MNDVAEFQLEARAWLAEQKPPEPTDDSERRFDDLRRWQRCLFDAGWLGLTWPVECGGRGLTALHQATFNRELARARAPRPAGVVGIEVVGPTIVAFGSEAQRRERLPRVLSGEDIWCQGFSEPEAGSDLASLRTRAERVADGWLINGHKVWTTWSHKATWCAVLARTNPQAKPHHGISYLLVPLDTKGITVRPLTQLNGDTEFGEVFFEDVLAPADALVGEVDRGWSYATHTLSSERGSLVLRRAADLAVAFDDLVAELAASGPIGEDQLAVIGELATDLVALDAQCDRIVERMTSAPDSPSAVDSLDKAMLVRVEQSLFGFARDCLGSWAHLPGRRPGGLDSARWAHDYVYGRAASIYGGTAQVQRNIIAERLLGLPREPRG
jgi:alkylation response protein AidB-like acyl-CoA dehydrogenase